MVNAHGKRPKEQCCISCRYYVGDWKGGECRRMPPTTLLTPDRNAIGKVSVSVSSAFAPTAPDKWCGEFMVALDLASIAEELLAMPAQGKG